MGPDSEKDVPPVPKRSLFKKSAWAQPAEVDDAVGLFSRSKEIFPEVIAENERRRKKLERSRSSVSIERIDSGIEQGKRRRISSESDDIGGSSTEDELAASILRDRRTSSTTAPQPPNGMQDSTSLKQKISTREESPPKRATRENKAANPAAIMLSDSEDDTAAKLEDAKPAVISFSDFDDFDDNDDIKIVKAPKSTTPPPIETLSSEDEYAEFVAKARAKARRKVFETIDPTKSNARAEASSDTLEPSKSESPELIRRVKSQPPAPDPIISILVTSEIEGTKPLLVKRKLSQRLKDVRIGWCDKQMIGGQPVPESTKRQIFLTWRGNKVFDVTTCQAMGLKLNPQGKVVSEGEGIDTEGRIQLEAWTQETFDEYKKRRAAEKNRHILNPVEENEEQLEPEESKPTEETRKFKIILKSKDYKDVKLKVSTTTTIAKIIGVFRADHKIPIEQDISLHLDGDPLEPASLLSAYDVDDDDTTMIDVHVG